MPFFALCCQLAPHSIVGAEEYCANDTALSGAFINFLHFSIPKTEGRKRRKEKGKKKKAPKLSPINNNTKILTSSSAIMTASPSPLFPLPQASISSCKPTKKDVNSPKCSGAREATQGTHLLKPLTADRRTGGRRGEPWDPSVTLFVFVRKLLGA